MFVWTCNNTNVGGLGSPCISSSECGSGLFCADERCSNGSAGSRCVIDDECADPLICTGRDKCGGAVGYRRCGGDSDCVPGLICALDVMNDDNISTSVCAPTNGEEGSACGRNGHCKDTFTCDDGVCGLGATFEEGRGCNSDARCAGNLVCALVQGTRECASTTNIAGGACSKDTHCLDGSICALSGDNQICISSNGNAGSACGAARHCNSDFICRASVCGKAAGETCSPGMCAGGLICTGAADSLTCTLPGDGAAGSVCGADDHCTSPLACGNDGMCGIGAGNACSSDRVCAGGLICTGAAGSLTCTLPGDGAAGSVCGADDHCTTSSLACGNDGMCGIGAGNACSSDRVCAGGLICTGAAGSLTCTLPGDGAAGSVCGTHDHCTTSSLACGNDGMCGIGAGNACSSDRVCAGGLICARDAGSLVCAQQGDGNERSVCGIDAHCTSPLMCGTGPCGRAAGVTCSTDSNCAGGLICAGAAGSLVCAQSDGSSGSVCGAHRHCTGSLVCSSTGMCGAGGACADDDDCAGNLICARVVGALICAQSDGSSGSACLPGSNHCAEGLTCSIMGNTRVCR